MAKGVDIFKSEGCSGVVIVGGGSAPCAGKGIALMAANGILIPYVMEFNLPVCADKFAQMAVAMGEKAVGMTFEELAVKAIERIKELFIITAYPTKMPSDVVTEKDIPDLVKQAMTRPMTKSISARAMKRNWRLST